MKSAFRDFVFHVSRARHRAQRDARTAVEAKLHDTATAVIDCIEKCLQEGDAYVAEQLLKGLGCFEGDLKDLGSEEAVTLAREALKGATIAEMLGGDRPASPTSSTQNTSERDDRV